MSDLKALERQLEDNRELVRKKNIVEKLLMNAEFKEIIVKGYCVDDCARAIKASADFNVPKDQREDCVNLAQSAGYLEKYLQTICTHGYLAEKNIPEIIESIEFVRSEEA